MKFALFMITPMAFAQNPPVFRSDTHVVEVTVIPEHRDGSFVNDLTVDDLRVFDDGKQQRIASLERLGAGDASAAKPSPRRSVIVLDALNTAFEDQVYRRRGVADALNGKLDPDERIAIFALDAKLRLLHDFSSDAESWRSAVQAYPGERPPGDADSDASRAICSCHNSARLSKRTLPVG